MKVYLDNNILISIEDKELSIDDILNENNNISFVYSYVHIQELLESRINFDDLKKKRVGTIRMLTNNAYVYADNNDTIGLKKENPETVIDLLKQYPILFGASKSAVENIDINRKRFIDFLKIEEKRMNNYSPGQVFEYLNSQSLKSP